MLNGARDPRQAAEAILDPKRKERGDERKKGMSPIYSQLDSSPFRHPI